MTNSTDRICRKEHLWAELDILGLAIEPVKPKLYRGACRTPVYEFSGVDLHGYLSLPAVGELLGLWLRLHLQEQPYGVIPQSWLIDPSKGNEWIANYEPGSLEWHFTTSNHPLPVNSMAWPLLKKLQNISYRISEPLRSPPDFFLKN